MEISTPAVLLIAVSAKESTYGAMEMNTQVSLLTALQMDKEQDGLQWVLTGATSMKEHSSIGNFMDKARIHGATVPHTKESL